MFDKLKSWVLGNVIVKKVIQKVAKHGATALLGFLNAPWASKVLVPILNQIGVNIDFDQFEKGMVVLLTGLLGGLWNYINHRFLLKTAPVALKQNLS